MLRDYLGGEILIADVLPAEGSRRERHAWNRLPSGQEVDLTFEQFGGGVSLAEPAVGEPFAKTRGANRHALLAERVREALADHA